MGFDLEGLARRALEAGEIKPKDIASRIILSDPWEHFTYSIKASSGTPGDFNYLGFPLNADELGIQIKWRRETTAEQKVPMFALGWAADYADPSNFINTFYDNDGYYSPRTSIKAGQPSPASRNGMQRNVRRLGVTSSPVVPSPRVAPAVKMPFS